MFVFKYDKVARKNTGGKEPRLNFEAVINSARWIQKKSIGDSAKFNHSPSNLSSDIEMVIL